MHARGRACSAMPSRRTPATVASASSVSSAATTTHCPSISSSTPASSRTGLSPGLRPARLALAQTSAPGKTPLNHVLSTWSCCASRQRTQLTDKISSMEHLGRALRPPGARPAAWRRTRQRSQRRTRAWPGTGARAAPSAAAAPGHRLGGRRAGAASLRRAMARHVIGSRAGGAIT